MVAIPLPITTAPGARRSEAAGRLINCYAEPLLQNARASHARRRSPGLREIAESTDDEDYVSMRGMHAHNSTLYCAWAERLQKVEPAMGGNAVTDLGDLPGTRRVSFARNNKAPVPDILCVTENDVYVVTSGGAPTSLNDGDLPQPLAVCFIDGYFVFPIRDGRFFFSGINDVTINALDFGRADSRPGGIWNAVPYGEMLLVCGTTFLEFWQNAGNPTGSPFSRAATFPGVGLASTFAIAGFEDEFSTIVFVGNDNAVYMLTGGYTPQRISTPDLDRMIASVDDKSMIDVTVSITEGHRWAAVTGPNFTWEYEVTTGLWHERASYLDDHWRAVCSVNYLGNWVMGDRTDNKVWHLDPSFVYEGENQVVMTVISAPMSGFPNRTVFHRVDFDVVVGQGLVAGIEPIETDPFCLISWSDDGGQSYKTPLKRDLGRLAESNSRVSVSRTGMAGVYGRVWRFDVADPVYVSLLAGDVTAEARSR